MCIERPHERRAIPQLAVPLRGGILTSRFQVQDVVVDAEAFQRCEIPSSKNTLERLPLEEMRLDCEIKQHAGLFRVCTVETDLRTKQA